MTDNLVNFGLLVVLAATVKKVTDFLKYARAGEWHNVATQIIVWAIAVGTTFLGANAQLFSHFQVGGVSIAGLDGPSLWLVGIGLGSGASTLFNDLLKAFDNTQSARTPDLVNGTR